MGSVKNYLQHQRAAGKKLLAVLIDPDKADSSLLDSQLDAINEGGIELIFFGGSLLTRFDLDEKLRYIRSRTQARIILFPGSVQQVSSGADAILFLSLISGRNPELLIGQHVLAAPMIKQANLEVLSTGYMLVDGGRPTTASYISGTLPLPADKPDIAACTALAGTMLGLSHIYLDAGSGALNPVSVDMIQAVREMVDVPLIVGGGIRDCDAAVDRAQAGADVVVVGNITEKKPLVIQEIAKAFKSISA
jgi:putative glycerol-1-phosphate prenyltransferase